MRSTSSHLVRGCCVLLMFLGGVPLAHADVLLAARTMHAPGVSLQGINATVKAAPDGGLQLQFTAAAADVAAMGWRRVGLAMQGSLHRDDQLRWLFEGTLKLSGAPGGALGNAKVRIVLSDAANTLLVDIVQGRINATTAMPLDQPSHAQISLKNLPLGWLQGLLGTVWSGRPTDGVVNAELALDLREAGVQSSGEFSVTGAGFDTPSGTLAGQAIHGAGRFKIDTANGPAQLDLDANFHHGELLLGPLYAKLPEHPVQVSMHATASAGAIALSRLRVSDPDAMQLDGAMNFDASGNLTTLRLEHFHASFPAAYQRYASAWLSTFGLRDLSTSGDLTASMDLRQDGLHGFAFHTGQLDLAQSDGSLAVSGLRGGLSWSEQGDMPSTTLGWHSMQFHRIVFGETQSNWQSHAGTLALQTPLEVPLLNGTMNIGLLDWRPAAGRGQRLNTSLAIAGVDMAAFSRAMGWPAFPGTLGGAIPSLRWVDDRFELQGGLSVNVFGGFVDITGLSLQQPFGATPVLSADILLKQLDLASITSVFDFGSITGRLDGNIDELRLVNWSPVAFKARLLADGGGRISQRAVNNLTSVGGGGIAGGLQGAVLKVFKTFGYKRIGISCDLQGSLCQMGGLGPANGGYTMLEGSGVPRLSVIGHQTRVDWPTLVERLRDAIGGSAPVIR